MDELVEVNERIAAEYRNVRSKDTEQRMLDDLRILQRKLITYEQAHQADLDDLRQRYGADMVEIARLCRCGLFSDAEALAEGWKAK